MPHKNKPDFTFGLTRSVTVVRERAPLGEAAGVLILTALKWTVLLWGGRYLAETDRDGLLIVVACGIIVAIALVIDFRKGRLHVQGATANEPSLPPA